MNNLYKLGYRTAIKLTNVVCRSYEKMIFRKCKEGMVELSKGNQSKAKEILRDVTDLSYFPIFLNNKSRMLERKL